MIATMYTLSRSDCKALRITDAYSVHRAVYNLFPSQPDCKRDFLFADQGGDFMSRRILILSERKPVDPPMGILEIKEVPSTFFDHTTYAFQVRVNPVKRDKKSGKLIPIRGRKDLGRWFLEKAVRSGFAVDESSLQIDKIGIQEFEKQSGTVTQGEAVFKGKLTVTDKQLFMRSFREGIGRGKAFGFGLLQIVPLAYVSRFSK